MATHGYASTDPSLSGSIPDAFEFVDVFTGRTYEPEGPGEQVGNWHVRFDDLAQVNVEMAKLLRKSNVPARLKVIDWGLRRSGHSFSNVKKMRSLKIFVKP